MLAVPSEWNTSGKTKTLLAFKDEAKTGDTLEANLPFASVTAAKENTKCSVLSRLQGWCDMVTLST